MVVTPCLKHSILEFCSLPNFNYQIEPYIGCGHYCYYCYVLSQAITDWRKEILTHRDLISQLNNELSDIPPQTIYLGWYTDPYQPCEAEHFQTRHVLELLLEKGFSANILTKSDLVLRDMDILLSMKNASVSVSVAFNDDDVRRLFEANTITTGARVSALRELKAAGINTSALLCPVMPYITDINPLIDLLAEHTEKIWIYGLSILNRSDQNWRNVERVLENHFPDLKEKVENAVFSKGHAYWELLRRDLFKFNEKRGLNLSVHV